MKDLKRIVEKRLILKQLMRYRRERDEIDEKIARLQDELLARSRLASDPHCKCVGAGFNSQVGLTA